MGRIRFSIAGLMGFVLVAALGFGGLKAADETWASACHTLAVVALILAVLAAIGSTGRSRACWSGFAIAGGVYFGLIFGAIGPARVSPPRLLTELLSDRLAAMIHPGITSSFTFTITGTVTVMPQMPQMPTPSGSPVPFSQVAHSLMALLVGMLGGLFSAWLFARRGRREAESAPGVSPSSP